MSPSIAVAVSGGVDSLVAAHLLTQNAAEVFAIHFLTGFEGDPAGRSPDAVHAIGAQLGIPVHIVDLSADFKGTVVDYFTATYLAGETPNPCIICNPSIKFGALLRLAESLGAGSLATGHYARIRPDASGRMRLFKGVDPHKDQSYFLARLSQPQLAKARFPLGGLTKAAVRDHAARHGLRPALDHESQDVCFIKAGSYREFIAGLTGREFRPGLIETTAGRVVGEHSGLHAYTVGQRRGINCPASEPYYVVRLDMPRNCLVVGSKKDLLSSGCKVARINWIAPLPDTPLRVRARVRYRSADIPALLNPVGPQEALLRFDAPQAAVTPGQAAVFYDGDQVLGGGFISMEIGLS